jgi:hypothetical protein
MKRPLSFTLICSLLIPLLHASEVPQKLPISSYSRLWTSSPFTAKPPEKIDAPIVNPLSDFTLTGIAPVPGGYRITIANKKNIRDKIVIEPGLNNGYTVLAVNRNPEIPLGTTVTLSKGNAQGVVQFEPNLITLNTAPKGAPNPNNPNQLLPPGANPGQLNPAPGTDRPPRSRVVPPSNQNPSQSNSNPSRSRRSR